MLLPTCSNSATHTHTHSTHIQARAHTHTHPVCIHTQAVGMHSFDVTYIQTYMYLYNGASSKSQPHKRGKGIKQPIMGTTVTKLGILITERHQSA